MKKFVAMFLALALCSLYEMNWQFSRSIVAMMALSRFD